MKANERRRRKNRHRFLCLLKQLNRPEYFHHQITTLETELDYADRTDKEYEEREVTEARRERRRFKGGKDVKIIRGGTT